MPGALAVDLDVMPWPWDTSSVEGLSSSHLVEHVADFVGFMNEAWRVLVPDGRFEIWHPYLWSNRAFQDPTHRRFLSESSWLYTNAEFRKVNGVDHYGGWLCDFEIEAVDFELAPEMEAERFEAIKRGRPLNVDQLIRKAVNVVDDLHVTLTARKP